MLFFSWNKNQEERKGKKETKTRKQKKAKKKDRKEERKKRRRERQRKRNRKRGRPKKAKEKQRETLKNKQKCPFPGGGTGFFAIKSKQRNRPSSSRATFVEEMRPIVCTMCVWNTASQLVPWNRCTHKAKGYTTAFAMLPLKWFYGYCSESW